ELSRNVRDSAWRQHLSWDCAFEEGDYSIWSDDSGTSLCEGASFGISLEKDPSDTKLYKINENRFVHDSSGVESQFSRKLTIANVDEIPGEKAKKFTCEVSWIKKSKERKIQISEILTDWRK
ncbi:MAG: hypothetical protein OEL89_05540, partial [Candidatus Peregrinibacteria bacterium]|nr:hypothetical protein [Candidatus Peregrinibacteria bacterium]